MAPDDDDKLPHDNDRCRRLNGHATTMDDIWNVFVFTGYMASLSVFPSYALGLPHLLLSASANNVIVQNDLWIQIFIERKRFFLSFLGFIPREIV